jgi:hypothetical protein
MKYDFERKAMRPYYAKEIIDDPNLIGIFDIKHWLVSFHCSYDDIEREMKMSNGLGEIKFITIKGFITNDHYSAIPDTLAIGNANINGNYGFYEIPVEYCDLVFSDDEWAKMNMAPWEYWPIP